MMTNRRAGFTIVELLIVIVIVAILAAITFVVYTGVQNRARTSSATAALSQVKKQLELYKANQNTNSYPLTGQLATAGVTDVASYAYTSDGTSFCLSTTNGPVVMRTTSNGVIENGNCTVVPPVFANSGFESPTTGNYTYQPAGGGWTFVNQSGIQRNGSAFFANNALEGVQTGFIQHNGTTGSISQTVTFTMSSNYRITFLAARRGSNVQPIRVTVGSTDLGTYTPSSTAFETLSTTPFAAAAGNQLITFAATNTSSDLTTFVDQIVIEAV